MPDIRNLWETSLGLLFLTWLVTAFLLLTMPLAMLLWIVIGLVVVLTIYFAGERLVAWGRGI